jgi:hypothetical protein
MKQRELDRILDLHAAYLAGQSEGEPADLSGQDLRGLNLSKRDLREANFSRADVREANFSGAKLADADFSGADARGANFSGANMANTNTSEADLTGANLSGNPVDRDNLNLGVVRRSRGRRHRENDTTPFSFAMTPDHPRVWYHSIYHDLLGHPILTNTTGTVAAVKASPVNMTYINHASKFPLTTLMEHPFMDWRQDVAALIKSVSPSGKCHIAWAGNLNLAFDVDTSFDWTYGAKYLLYNSPDRRLRAADNSTWPAFGNGSYFIDTGPIKDQFLQIWLSRGATSGVANGFWIDWAWGNISSASSGLDPSKNGYSSNAESDASSNAGMLTVMSGLKRYGEIWANGEMSETNRANLSGRIRESMDPDEGHSGVANDHPPNGFLTYDAYLADCMLYMGPGADGGGMAVCIASQNDSDTIWSAAFGRVSRFCVGTAALCGGYGTIVCNDLGAGLRPMLIWADEWSVNPDGTVDSSGAHIGWLGRPTERPTKDASGIWVRRFQKGIVLVNPTGNTGIDSKNITLERPYRRIAGVQDPTINNGAVQQTVTVGAHDSAFMLR